jgi:hypothetical protein
MIWLQGRLLSKSNQGQEEGGIQYKNMIKFSETTINISGKQVRRLRSSIIVSAGTIAIILGVVLLILGKPLGGTLILIVSPFFYIYVLVREALGGRDSVVAVLLTSYLDYKLNQKIRGSRTSRRRR